MNPIKAYYNSLVDRLNAEFTMSGVGGHAADTGTNREVLIRDFLNKHFASRLSADLGGKILGFEQPASAQMDVVVKNDLSPRFEENEKAFFLAENVVAAISVKSHLSKESIFEALANLATVPKLSPKAVTFKALKSGAYAEYEKFHPRLFVFAYGGVSCETATRHVVDFYDQNPNIPGNRKPLSIIVNGKYTIRHSVTETKTFDGTPVPAGVFYGSLLPENFRGYPLVDMVNSVSSCLGWLPWMELNPYEYFNAGYWEEE